MVIIGFLQCNDFFFKSSLLYSKITRKLILYEKKNLKIKSHIVCIYVKSIQPPKRINVAGNLILFSTENSQVVKCLKDCFIVCIF